MLKCTKIDDFFRKRVDKPKEVEHCKLCQALGAGESVNCQGPNENEHAKMHRHQLRLISNSLTNHGRGKKSTNAVGEPLIKLGLNQNKSISASDGSGSKVLTDGKSIAKQSKLGVNDLGIIRRLHCRQLVEKFKDRSKIPCRLCRLEITFSIKDCNAPVRLTSHILLRHLEKPVFVCRRCKKPYKNRTSLFSHFKSQHRASMASGEYEDHSNDFHEEIMSLLSQCFDWRDQKNEKERLSHAKSKSAIGGVRSKLKIEADQELRAFRHQRCKELAQNADKTNSIYCQLCSKLVPCKVTHISRQLIGHVSKFHLKQALFRCGRCSRRINNLSGLWCHMKRNHGINKIGGEYEDLSNDFHQEIMSFLSKCFELSGKGGESSTISEKSIEGRNDKMA